MARAAGHRVGRRAAGEGWVARVAQHRGRPVSVPVEGWVAGRGRRAAVPEWWVARFAKHLARRVRGRAAALLFPVLAP